MPAPFDYRKPKSLEDAAALLGAQAGEAKILAGDPRRRAIDARRP